MKTCPGWFNRIKGILTVLLIALIFAVPGEVTVHADSQINIPVKVSFSGTGLPKETFTVALTDEKGGTAANGSVTLSAGTKTGVASLSLDGLPVGMHTYELKEVAGDNPDITYSKEIYTYNILIKEDGTTEMKAVNKDDPSDKPDQVEFSNVYKAKGPDEVIGDPPVRVRKIISGRTPPKVDRFVFVMKPEKPDYPLPDVKAAGSGVIKDGVAEVYLDGVGEIEIGNLTFTEEGVYRYFVMEKDTAVEGYDYDDARFTVVYNVSRDQKGELTCLRTIIKKGGDKVDYCEFDNIYDPNPVIRRLHRAVKTGDPTVMWPLTLMCIMLMVMITFLLDRRNRRGAGEQNERRENGR